ncbi:hypothetical protein [Variovorax sp. VRV01]|uniref:hypothetical protein n=1 Tax=Variovorax sp. VRV01 TaxID=2769259 RepID=UPI00178044FA|nr:hypothetical protein [Variovorax sp. VRV01]
MARQKGQVSHLLLLRDAGFVQGVHFDSLGGPGIASPELTWDARASGHPSIQDGLDQGQVDVGSVRGCPESVLPVLAGALGQPADGCRESLIHAHLLCNPADNLVQRHLARGLNGIERQLQPLVLGHESYRLVYEVRANAHRNARAIKARHTSKDGFDTRRPQIDRQLAHRENRQRSCERLLPMASFDSWEA